jgi:hypothetical protein
MKRRGFLTGMTFLLSTPARASEFEMQFGSARATVEIEGDSGAEFSGLVRRWLGRSAEAVQSYYGRFPVPEVYIHIVVSEGAGVRGGQTFPGEMPLIRMRVGKNSTEADLLQKYWVLVHEMVHLAFPWMNLRNNWMAEGLAVYVESIARVHAGHLTPARIWRDFMNMMPRGLPAPGDGGFDVTVNWGRTYWGGGKPAWPSARAPRHKCRARLPPGMGLHGDAGSGRRGDRHRRSHHAVSGDAP